MSARTSRTPEPALTPEQIAIALRHLKRPGWPDSTEAVLAHPLYGKLVLGLARQMQRQRPCLPHLTVRRGPPVPPTPTAPRVVVKAPRFDPKRAAANDFD